MSGRCTFTATHSPLPGGRKEGGGEEGRKGGREGGREGEMKEGTAGRERGREGGRGTSFLLLRRAL
jgi:hypothetical protein